MRKLSLGADAFGELASEIVSRGVGFSFRAHGSSMLPFVRDGAVLTILPADPARLRRADIILYRSPHGLRAHRIVGVCRHSGETVFHAQGDALLGQSERLGPDQILGRVVGVAYGTMKIAIGSPFWRFLGLVWMSSAPVSQLLLRLLFQALRTARSLLV
jgi:hypothetical protein